MNAAQDGLPPLREVVERHGLMAQKALGQNFLFDLNLTGRIARAAGHVVGQTSTDAIVIGDEVVEAGDWTGPGAARRVLREDPKGEAVGFVER